MRGKQQNCHVKCYTKDICHISKSIMDRIVNIETQDNVVTGLFLTTDIAEANMLRRAILAEIETYTIDIVSFHINTSPRHDEIIALRLGQLIIDHARFVPSANDEFKTRIDVKGPTIFTSDNIKDIPFAQTTEIVHLKEGQRVLCDVIVRKGQGETHVKWRPVSRVGIRDDPNGFKITFKSIGMMSGEEIFRQGYEKISAAAKRPATTVFSQLLLPANME